LLLAKGVPMKVVQEIMRHANFTITMDTYSHLLPSALEDAARVMNDIFSPPVATPVATPQRKETIQ
jgi:integrase